MVTHTLAGIPTRLVFSNDSQHTLTDFLDGDDNEEDRQSLNDDVSDASNAD
jgi:hypothetical protein